MAQAPSNTAPPGREVATLAGGCFWCLEAVFDELKGVEAVESGYMGGRTRNPNYHQVCEGNTGHAEVVRITFDPAVVSFDELLEVFFVIHDPTTLGLSPGVLRAQSVPAVLPGGRRPEGPEVSQALPREAQAYSLGSHLRERAPSTGRLEVRTISP
jgi:peptide-methionine (S)-S-oxide reductase